MEPSKKTSSFRGQAHMAKKQLCLLHSRVVKLSGSQHQLTSLRAHVAMSSKPSLMCFPRQVCKEGLQNGDPSGSKYPIFKGLWFQRPLRVWFFGTRVLKCWLLGPSGDNNRHAYHATHSCNLSAGSWHCHDRRARRKAKQADTDLPLNSCKQNAHHVFPSSNSPRQGLY